MFKDNNQSQAGAWTNSAFLGPGLAYASLGRYLYPIHALVLQWSVQGGGCLGVWTVSLMAGWIGNAIIFFPSQLELNLKLSLAI